MSFSKFCVWPGHGSCKAKCPVLNSPAMPWQTPSLSKGETGKVDEFRFFTPPFRCSFSCCHMFSNDSPAEKKFLQRNKKETCYLYTKLLKSLGINVQGEMGSTLKIVFVHHNTEWKKKKRKEKKMDCSCQCAVLDFVLWTSTRCSQRSISFFFESVSPRLLKELLPGCLKAASRIWEMRVHKNMMGTSLRKRAVQNKGTKFEERRSGRVKKEEPWRPPRGACECRAYHTAAVCLMLWKLIRVGDVGIDMARATRTRREWWSCQRCHLFLAAERTW